MQIVDSRIGEGVMLLADLGQLQSLLEASFSGQQEESRFSGLGFAELQLRLQLATTAFSQRWYLRISCSDSSMVIICRSVFSSHVMRFIRR